MTGPSPVNPDEGQVAIPTPSGYVVGRLGARAMRWVEESLGRTIDDVWTGFVRKVEAINGGTTDVGATLPVSASATVIWAAIEHERRLAKAAGPEFTIDDADDIVDHVGIDSATSYALALVQLSMPFRKRTLELEARAAAAGAPSPVDPLRRAAMAAATPASDGTGTPISTSPSTPASTSTEPGA